MRLIDADAFRREIDNHWPFTREEQSKHGIADMAKSTLLYVLNTMPTIEERKTGKWTNRWAQNGDQVKEVRECSECGAVYLRFYDTADGFDCVPPKYCPNCGAKMEGAGSEDIPMEYFESGGR